MYALCQWDSLYSSLSFSTEPQNGQNNRFSNGMGIYHDIMIESLNKDVSLSAFMSDTHLDQFERNREGNVQCESPGHIFAFVTTTETME